MTITLPVWLYWFLVIDAVIFLIWAIYKMYKEVVGK